MFRLSFKSQMRVFGSEELIDALFFQDFDVLPAALFWLDSTAKSVKGFEFVSLVKLNENETQKK